MARSCRPFILTFSMSASCLCCSFSFSSWCLASSTLIFTSVWEHTCNFNRTFFTTRPFCFHFPNMTVLGKKKKKKCSHKQSVKGDAACTVLLTHWWTFNNALTNIQSFQECESIKISCLYILITGHTKYAGVNYVNYVKMWH